MADLMQKVWQDLAPPNRILMGPGPSNVDPRVLRVMTHQPVGHLDPEFLNVMDEVREGLRRLFRTGNGLTFPISGTGSAGMEASLANLIEDGDKVLVFVKGYFGDRIAQMAKRLGAEVVVVEQEWGKAFDPDDACEAIRQHKPKVVAIVHAETSTGVLQPVEEIARCVREVDAILVLDTVTSLGGVPVLVDDWCIDVSYSATQKCVGAPPGLAPVTFNSRAVKFLQMRKSPCKSWYFDALLVKTYWGEDRAYHHTAPINMVFALREALRLIEEEGLENRWERHRVNGQALAAGLEGMGMTLLVSEPEQRLPVLTTVLVPEGVDEAHVRLRLLNEFHLEIGAGLGPLKGKVWRFGLMGYSCQKRNVFLALSALGAILREEGFLCDVESGIAAAQEVYQNFSTVAVEV
ncbi:MAG: alanine--glyoxylate aminotransferase family protein [Armatimonadetes bacterium]|nr:alanine--glyoxylate aminotransferase family protein [Armatimonadota bacterium]MDW8026952.1 alanine--glyoxylate aminotransferase family protein [Armatimonadota bacterium]